MGRSAIVDPTKNVLDLVTAEARRQDDLRAASERRQDDLRVEAERFSAIKHQHSREVIQLIADHAQELREAETKRLDAAANQVLNTAETMRVLVSTTADTLAKQTATITDQLSNRVAQLERSSYEGSGKSQVVDPLMAKMSETLDRVSRNMAEGQGGKASRVEGRSNIGMIVGILGGVFGFISVAVAIFAIAT